MYYSVRMFKFAVIGFMIMKKTLFIVLAAVMLLSGCGGLRIVMNTHDSDGSRTVLTSDKHLFNTFDMALGAKIAKRDTVLGIMITSDRDADHSVFVKGDKMLFKLADESVITLENVYEKGYEKETVTGQTTVPVDNYGYAYSYSPVLDDIYVTPYSISTFVPRTFVRTTTRSYAIYLVSKKQLHDIMEKGVIKIRIEMEDSDQDMKSTSGVSQMVSDLYECLKEGIAKAPSHAEF